MNVKTKCAQPPTQRAQCLMNVLMATSLLVAFCFSVQSQAVEQPVVEAPAKKPPVLRQAKRPPAASASLDSDSETGSELTAPILYQVLLAEFALQHGDTLLASKAYADLALRTRDPQVLERTVEVALYARRNDLALEAARMLVKVDPESQRAKQLLHGVMILSNQIDELAPSLIATLQTDKAKLGDHLLGLNQLLLNVPDRAAVLRLVEKVCEPFLHMAEAHYAIAVAASSAGAPERALAEARKAQTIRPGWEVPVMLEAQLLMRSSPEAAIALMQRYLSTHPKASELQLLLARVLVSEKRYAEAKKHFEALLQAFPNSPEVVYPVAVLALQEGDKTLAERQFRHLLSLNVPDKSVAYYYLGQIAEEADRPEEAMAYYSLIITGDQYLPAQLRSARLMAKQGHVEAARRILKSARANTDDDRLQILITEASVLRDAKRTQEAFDLLETALAKQPENTDLLYETAMLAEKMERMEVVETRLRTLIKLQPDSHLAYNALGYSFADRNINLPEAREMIEKANKLAPDDPFILDSMGWVLFRQGDYVGALNFLERAYAKRSDPEIAAHIADVLWALGRKDEARRVLNEALKKHSDSEVLGVSIKQYAP